MWVSLQVAESNGPGSQGFPWADDSLLRWAKVEHLAASLARLMQWSFPCSSSSLALSYSRLRWPLRGWAHLAIPRDCALSAHRGELRRTSHLMDAVRAFARSGFSVSAAARDIHLHANSVTYRLDRWQHLTGWDARTSTA